MITVRFFFHNDDEDDDDGVFVLSEDHDQSVPTIPRLSLLCCLLVCFLLCWTNKNKNKRILDVQDVCVLMMMLMMVVVSFFIWLDKDYTTRSQSHEPNLTQCK